MSCNFWCHETKQLNQTIETYNNGNKRDMIRQRRKERQRRDQCKTEKKSSFSNIKKSFLWKLFIHFQDLNSIAKERIIKSLFDLISTYWLRDFVWRPRIIVQFSADPSVCHLGLFFNQQLLSVPVISGNNIARCITWNAIKNNYENLDFELIVKFYSTRMNNRYKIAPQ